MTAERPMATQHLGKFTKKIVLSVVRDRDCSNARHVTRINDQCCPVASMRRHVSGKHGAIVAPCICVDVCMHGSNVILRGSVYICVVIVFFEL